MSYVNNRKMKKRRALAGLGSVESVVTTALDISQDPYLPEVICRVNQLHEIEVGQPVQECVDTADGLVGGIGLRKIMTPLRAFVYAEQHKWVYPVAALAVIGLPMLIGYEIARKS